MKTKFAVVLLAGLVIGAAIHSRKADLPPVQTTDKSTHCNGIENALNGSIVITCGRHTVSILQ